MAEQIFDPNYWEERLRLADPRQIHHAIFRCSLPRWEAIEEAHRKLLEENFGGTNLSIIDLGCGWGRLLNLLPGSWNGRYLGVDLSPAFINKGREAFPTKEFLEGDLRTFSVPDRFDVGIMISIRPMIRRNAGEEAWAKVLENSKRHASKILYLEYDAENPGYWEL